MFISDVYLFGEIFWDLAIKDIPKEDQKTEFILFTTGSLERFLCI